MDHSSNPKGRGRGTVVHNQDLTSELRRPYNISSSSSPASGDNLESAANTRPRNISYAAVAATDHRQQPPPVPDATIFNSWSDESLSTTLPISKCPNKLPKQAMPMARNAESSLPERTNNPTIPYEITATAVNVTPGIYLESNSNYKKQSGLSPFAKEFVPRGFSGSEGGGGDPHFRDEITIDDQIIISLNNFITDVSCNPGKYDSSVKGICSILKLNIKSDSMLHTVVDTIFSQAIIESNFRYNAARLCNKLNTNCQFQGLSVNFMEAVLQRSLQDFSLRESLINSDQARLQGFTFFLGELYTQIEINNQRISSIAKWIPQLLDTLLNVPSYDNYKTVCQVLKFTGADLEDDEKQENNGTNPLMEKVMKRLEECINIAPREVQGMMRSVVELQSKNWGRRASPSPPILNNCPPTVPLDPYNDMVYYGPDGLPLTEEEQLFMESNQPESDGDGDDDDLSDEMDEEIRAAFEEFLVTTGQDQ